MNAPRAGLLRSLEAPADDLPAPALVPVPTGSLRARARPWTLVTLFAWEAALALVLGSQVASVATSAYGQHPQGDAPLFAADGLALLDLLRHSGAVAGPLLSTAFVVALLARFGGLLPSAIALAQLAFSTPAHRAPTIREVVPRALAALPATFTVTVLAFTVQATIALFGFVGAGAANTAATARFGELQGGEAFVVIGVFTLLGVAVVGVAADLARAAVVRSRSTAIAGVEASLAALAARPGRVLFSWGWREAASLVPMALAGALTLRVPAASRGAAAMVVIAFLHQVVIVARIAIRASWMAAALRSIRPLSDGA